MLAPCHASYMQSELTLGPWWLLQQSCWCGGIRDDIQPKLYNMTIIFGFLWHRGPSALLGALSTSGQDPSQLWGLFCWPKSCCQPLLLCLLPGVLLLKPLDLLGWWGVCSSCCSLLLEEIYLPSVMFFTPKGWTPLGLFEGGYILLPYSSYWVLVIVLQK